MFVTVFKKSFVAAPMIKLELMAFTKTHIASFGTISKNTEWMFVFALSPKPLYL